jgi:aspartate-semialdehyde dehydrogenase
MESKVKNDPVVAIVGVTGAVGAEFIATMDKRGFRIGKLKALASARSAGKTIGFRGARIAIEELNEDSFEGDGEETKVIKETRKIFEDDRIAVGALNAIQIAERLH